jgi:hypothetical protein
MNLWALRLSLSTALALFAFFALPVLAHSRGVTAVLVFGGTLLILAGIRGIMVRRRERAAARRRG